MVKRAFYKSNPNLIKVKLTSTTTAVRYVCIFSVVYRCKSLKMLILLVSTGSDNKNRSNIVKYLFSGLVYYCGVYCLSSYKKCSVCIVHKQHIQYRYVFQWRCLHCLHFEKVSPMHWRPSGVWHIS